MGPRAVVETEVYASYHQFYVADAEAEPRSDLVWDGQGLERHLGVAEGLMAVGTVAHGIVPVRIEIWDEEPRGGLDEWDHVVEASLGVCSGRVALATVEGPADIAPVEVDPGCYRIRSAASGLDAADEVDGGDRYRLQLWLAPSRDPEVLKWWAPWDPSGAVARPTTAGGRILLGAEAEDGRTAMTWLASRGQAHLFRDDEGTFWEHSNLPDTRGTPQLEELSETEAESRYGSRGTWAPPIPPRPSVGSMLRNIVQTVRYQRGWRPLREPEETVVDGRRVLLGGSAVSRTSTMRWLASKGGDNLHLDEDGTFWEWRNADATLGNAQLRELTADEARAKYAIEP